MSEIENRKPTTEFLLAEGKFILTADTLWVVMGAGSASQHDEFSFFLSQNDQK